MKSSEKIRILLADNHAIVARGIELLIATDRKYQVSSVLPVNLVNAIEGQAPDIVVLDIGFASGGGLEVIKNVLFRFPKARLLILTALGEDVYARRTLAVGAKGFVSKSETPEVLFRAIDTVATGGIYVNERLYHRALADWIHHPETATHPRCRFK